MATDQRQKILSVGVDASGAKQGFDEIKQGAKDSAQAVKQSGEEAAKGLDAIGKGADNASQKLDKNTRSIINSIQRTTAALDAGERGSVKYFETLAGQRGVSTDALRPYLAQLDQVIAKQKEAAKAGMGQISDRQYAAAMRGVPAQFTDIVTSLQGGQAPLTVMLQQGGQLKDMFGGVGNAARAMGSYIAGLISPLTLAAGAAAALGVAFAMGSREAEGLSKAVILTGNSAGASVNQLKNIAAEISASTGATVGAATDAIQQVVMTAQVSQKNIGLVASAALAMKKATGTAIEDTVSQFAELGKEPVKASMKLNEQYGYLTAEVYKQIKALEDQGKTLDAANLAQETFGKAMEERAQSITQNVGTLEQAWNGIISAAKGAWDAMLGIGREGSLEQKLAQAKKDLANGGGLFGGESEARSKIAVLEAQIESQNKLNKSKEEEVSKNKNALAWEQEKEKYLTRQAQKYAEIQKAKNLYAASGSTDQKELNTVLSQIEEKYKEKKSADPMRSRDHNEMVAQLKKDADTELDAIQKRNKELKASAEAYQYLQDIQAKFSRSNAEKIDSMSIMPESVARLNTELRKVDQTADEAKNRLARMFGDGKLTADDYALRLKELNDLMFEQRRVVIDLNAEQEKLNSTWEYGAAKAIQQYQDAAKNVASQTQTLFTSAFRNMEDALVSFAQTGKFNFKQLANSVIADIIRMQTKAAMSNIMSSFSGYFSGSWNNYGVAAQQSAAPVVNAVPSANGNVFPSSVLSAHSSSIVDKPTFFSLQGQSVMPFAKGGAVGVAGEAGAEAIMPLKRDSSGRLGVTAEKGSGGDVTVNVYNSTDSQTKTQSRTDGKGNKIIDVFIEQVKSAIAGDISSGNGAVPSAIEKTYGVGRMAGAY